MDCTNELLQELKTAQEIVGLLKAKRVLNDNREKTLVAREIKVDEDEKALAIKVKAHEAWETADVTLQKALAAQAEARKMLQNLETERAAFETAQATQVDRINALKHSAQEVVDQADQVRKDKLALDAEKLTYKARIITEIRSKLGA